MKNTLKFFTVVLCLAFGIQAGSLASSIEISDTYAYGYEFNADTLLVVGDCNSSNITLKPGTFVLFKGDYTIELHYLKSIGTETNSITICGNVLPNDTIKQGSIKDYNLTIWQSNPSIFSLTNLINLKRVELSNAKKCSFLECHSVMIRRSKFNKVLRNNIVSFDYSVDNCSQYKNYASLT